MQGHRIGYVRVSSFDQNPERQLEQTQVSKVFTDKASGKDTQRPQLEALLSFVREGDTVVVHSMDRLARNLDDLRRLVQKLTQRGVRIEFLKEGLVFTGEDSPMANLMLSVMGAFAEFERALIRERQREGIALMIDWILDAELQRRAQIGLNKGEAHHALKRAISFHRRGEIRDRSAEGQHYRIAGMNLLAAIIIFWNTMKLGEVVANQKRDGKLLSPDLLAHVSPLGWEHINLTGEYRWPKP
nr:recombinase family protein [Salmonella enterica]